MLYVILAGLMLSLNAQTVDTPVKQLLLSLSDEELVKAAMNGRAGKCSIVDAKNCPQCFCDFYAKTSKARLQGVGVHLMCTTNTTIAKPPSVALAWARMLQI